MNRIAYIAGKVTGVPKEERRDRFNTVASKLTDNGYKVIEPVGVADDEPSWNDAIRSDIKKMLDCDEVHMLPDWQESRGAQLERDIALRLGMHVVYH